MADMMLGNMFRFNASITAVKWGVIYVDLWQIYGSQKNYPGEDL